MNRIIVIANLTSLRAFKIDSEYADENEMSTPRISEFKTKKSKVCSSWDLQDYINELVLMVDSVVLEADADSWVFAIPFNLTRQVLPLLDKAVGARLEEVLMEDLISLSIDQVAQILSPASCDRFGHQRGQENQFEPSAQ